MKATYNGVGSRKRNTPPGKRTVGKAYGFLADMRLRFDAHYQKFCAKYRKQNPRVSWRTVLRAFYARPRNVEIRHYGTEYTLHVLFPYVVVTDYVGVVGIFPCYAQSVLVFGSDAERLKRYDSLFSESGADLIYQGSLARRRENEYRQESGMKPRFPS